MVKWPGPDEATQEQKLNASDKLIRKKTPDLSGKQGNKKLSTNKWSITLYPPAPAPDFYTVSRGMASTTDR